MQNSINDNEENIQRFERMEIDLLQLEQHLLQIIDEAINCQKNGQKVSPNNIYVNKMVENAANIIKMTSKALGTLGHVRKH